MKKAILTTLTLALVSMAPARAAESLDSVMERLYTKLLHIMQGDKDIPADQIVIMANPGIPMPDDLKPETNEDDKHALNQLFDTVPLVYPRFFDSGETFTSVYTRVLRDKVVDPLALSDTVKATKKARIEELRKLLSGPDADAEKQAGDAYFAAYDALAQATLDAKADPTKRVPLGLKKAPGPLLTKWNTAKGIVEGYQTELDQLLNEDPLAAWGALVTLANDNKDQAGTLKVEFFPAYHTWAGTDSKGWTEFTFSSKEKVETSASNTMAAELEASYKKGSTSIAMGGSYAEAAKNALNRDSELSLKIQLKRINVYHPGMDKSIFKNDRWYWNANSVGKVIANGATIKQQLKDALAGKTNTQLMPIITTGAWLARNLEITGSFAEAVRESVERDIKAHLDVSVGPINVGGKFAKHDSKTSFVSKEGKAGIFAPDPQIIGFVATQVGKSPTGVPKGQ